MSLTRMTRRLATRAISRILAVFLGYFVVQGVLLAVTGSPVWAALGGAAFTIPAFWFLHAASGGAAAPAGLFRFPRKSAWLWLAGLVFVWLAGQALGLLMMQIFPDAAQSYMRRVQTLEADTMVLMLVLTLLAAPIGEELLMRGVLYGEMRRGLRMPVWAAVLISAAVFALMHGNMFQIASTLTLGALLALAYEHTRSILVPIALHGVYNVLSTFVPASAVTPLATPLYVTVLNVGTLAGLACLCAARSR